MITANQAERYRAAFALYEAHSRLIPLRCSAVLTTQESRDALERALAEIDALFGVITPK